MSILGLNWPSEILPKTRTRSASGTPITTVMGGVMLPRKSLIGVIMKLNGFASGVLNYFFTEMTVEREVVVSLALPYQSETNAHS